MPINNSIVNVMYGDKLRILRGPKSQVLIAKRLGIRQGDYSLLENGRKDFTSDLIKNISSYFKVPLYEFKKFEVTASVEDFLNKLRAAGAMPSGDLVENKAHSLLLLSQEEMIRELKAKLMELSWKCKQFESAAGRLSVRRKSRVYVAV